MAIEVRSAQVGDVAFIASAHAEIVALSQQDLEADSAWVMRDIFCEGLKADVLVAWQNGQRVGMLLYSKLYFAEDGEVLWVSQLYVCPQHRGLSVARALMRKAAELNDGCRGFCWATSKANGRSYELFKRVAKSLDEFTMFFKAF